MRRWKQIFVIESQAIDMFKDLLWRCVIIYGVCHVIMPHRVSVLFTVVRAPARARPSREP